jgi:hypothetical protein
VQSIRPFKPGRLGDQQATLQQIANAIQTKGQISPATIGDSLFNETMPTLNHHGELSVAVINVTIDNKTLKGNSHSLIESCF